MDKYKDIVEELVARPFWYGKRSRCFFCKAEIGDLHDHLQRLAGHGSTFVQRYPSIRENAAVLTSWIQYVFNKPGKFVFAKQLGDERDENDIENKEYATRGSHCTAPINSIP